MLVGVAREEFVRNRVGKIPLAHHVRPDGQAVGRITASTGAFAIVITEHEEQRNRLAGLPEVEPLREILFGGGLPIRVLLGHEGVAQIDMKVRLFIQRAGQGSLIDGRLGAFVEMRIRGNRERERIARRAGGVKCELGTVTARRTELVTVFGVGLQRRENDFHGLPFPELPFGGLGVQLARFGSVGEPTFHIIVAQDTHRNRFCGGPTQNQVKRVRWNIIALGGLDGLLRPTLALRFVPGTLCDYKAVGQQQEEQRPSHLSSFRSPSRFSWGGLLASFAWFGSF